MESGASQDSICTENVKVDLDSEEENCAICAYYELPVGGKLIPGLLHGLNLPEKRISGGDIMDTILWHERSRYQYEDKYRNANNNNNRGKSNEGSRSRFQSSSSSGGSVFYKGAGVGWSTSGSGRGKQPHTPDGNDMGLNRKMTSLGISRQTNQSSSTSTNTYNHGFQAEAKPFVWGRGRGSDAWKNNNFPI